MGVRDAAGVAVSRIRRLPGLEEAAGAVGQRAMSIALLPEHEHEHLFTRAPGRVWYDAYASGASPPMLLSRAVYAARGGFWMPVVRSTVVRITALLTTTPGRRSARRVEPFEGREARVTIDEAVASFLAHRRLRGISPGSIEQYRRWLSFWQRWRVQRELSPDLDEIDIEELRAWFHYLRTEHVPHHGNRHRPPAERLGLAPASLESCWCILRAFWRYVADEGGPAAPTGWFRTGRLPRPKVPQQLRPTYEAGQIVRLVEACAAADPEEAARNRAMLMLLWESGMRITELCRLQDADLCLDERCVCVHGKGDKERWAFWGPRGAAALAAYLALRIGPAAGPLFRGLGSKNMGGPLTSHAVRSWLRRLARKAGVDLPPGAPLHALRHTFAHMALDAGIDGLHLQQLLGHASPVTTQRYVRENRGQLGRVHARIWGDA